MWKCHFYCIIHLIIHFLFIKITEKRKEEINLKKTNSSGKPKRDFTKLSTPHTYVIIFGVVIFAWILTFVVPAGKFSTQDIEYKDANGETSTRTVLRQDSFRYAYELDKSYVFDQLE